LIHVDHACRAELSPRAIPFLPANPNPSMLIALHHFVNINSVADRPENPHPTIA
jgi:hypothetical protein